MANQLALPTFVTGPADKLAAVDVYKTQQQAGQVVNSVRSILQKYDPTLARSLSGFNSTDIRSLTAAALKLGGAGKAGAIGQQLLSRAMAVNPGIAASIRSMDAAIKEKFTSTMGSIGSGINGAFGEAKGALSGAMSDAYSSAKGFVNETLGSSNFSAIDPANLTCTIGDVTSPISFADAGRIQSLGDIINGVTGESSFKIKDIAGEVGLYTATIKECFDCNISGATKDIFSVIADRQVVGIVAREVLPDVVRYSSIDDLYNLSTNVYQGDLLGASPSLLNLFAKSFGNDQKSRYYGGNYSGSYSKAYGGSYGPSYGGVNSAKHTQTYADLLQAYDSTYPGWNTYIRHTDEGDEAIIDITSLIGGSPTFNSVISTGATNSDVLAEKPYLLAPILKSEDIQQQLTRQYPKTKFYFDTPVEKVKDPRALNRI